MEKKFFISLVIFITCLIGAGCDDGDDFDNEADGGVDGDTDADSDADADTDADSDSDTATETDTNTDTVTINEELVAECQQIADDMLGRVDNYGHPVTVSTVEKVATSVSNTCVVTGDFVLGILNGKDFPLKSLYEYEGEVLDLGKAEKDAIGNILITRYEDKQTFTYTK